VDLREPQSKEFHDLYSLPHVTAIKSEKMRWAGHVACMVVGEECALFGLET